MSARLFAGFFWLLAIWLCAQVAWGIILGTDNPPQWVILDDIIGQPTDEPSPITR